MKIGEIKKALNFIKNSNMENPKIICIGLDSILVEDKNKNKCIVSKMKIN